MDEILDVVSYFGGLIVGFAVLFSILVGGIAFILFKLGAK